MTTVKAFLATSVGLIGGGLGYITFMGYDPFVVDLWMRAIPLFLSSPQDIFSQAMGGATAPLFQGIAMVGSGVLLVVVAAIVWVAKPLVRDVFKKGPAVEKTTRKVSLSALRLRPKTVARSAQKIRDDEGEFGDEVPSHTPAGSKPSTLQKIQQRIQQSRVDREFSQELGDDGAGHTDSAKTTVASWMSMLKKRPSKQPALGLEDFRSQVDAGEDTIPALPQYDGQTDFQATGPIRVLGARHSQKKTARIRLTKVDAGANPNPVQARLDTVWDSMVGRLRGMLDRRKPMETAPVESEEDKARAQAGALDAQMLEWFKSVQAGGRSVRELTKEAAQIRAMLDEEGRERFVERNSIDGSFILRLIDSWATRTDAETAPEDAGDRAAYREAIRAVYRERAGQIKKDDDSVPDEFKHDLDEVAEDSATEEFGIDEKEEWTQAFSSDRTWVPQPQEPDAQEQPTLNDAQEGTALEDDANSTARLVEKLQEVAARMQEYSALMERVKNGEDEWPPHLEEEDFRSEEVEDIDRVYGSLSFMMTDDEILSIAQSSEDSAMEWLAENPEIVHHGFLEFVRRMDVGAFEEDDEEGGDDEGDMGDEGADNPSDASEPDTDHSALEEEQGEAFERPDGQEPQDDSTLQVPSGEVSEILSPVTADRPVERQEDEGFEAAMPDAADEGALEETDSPDDLGSIDAPDLTGTGGGFGDEKSVLVEPVMPPVESHATEKEEPASLEDGAKEDETPLEAEEEEALDEAPAPAHVPANVGKDDLEEMSLAGSFIAEWGVMSKEAGASAGTMMRFVSEKRQDRFVPLGLIHLVMQWKRESGSVRANVIFRHLEEGVWDIDPLVPGRFVRDNGDWVEVRQPLLEHDEVRAHLTAIHIHGPGASEDLEQKAASWGGMWVVGSTPSPSEMLRRIEQGHA